MPIEEKISKHLGKPYIYLKDKKKFLCSNGVLFTLEEFKNGIDINAEYERRAKEDMLYDYAYAKNTGLLRKKRGYAKKQEDDEGNMGLESNVQESEAIKGADNDNNFPERNRDSDIQRSVAEVDLSRASEREWEDTFSRRLGSMPNRPEKAERKNRSVFLIILILAFASGCSMYESTLHTATYLYDYVDLISAWLLSTAVTAYNSSAFEVSVMFHNMKRNFMAFIFMLLWAMVTFFSMATTVSVFYDRFNFNETQIAQENKAVDSNRLGLELLRTKEKDLREAIDFKKKDIEYRQEREYATTAVRLELEALQKELQENLSEQQKLLSETPEVMEEKIQRKESLFAFLARLMGIDGGILEFAMSTLSAIFINLIAPLSVTAVIEINRRKEK